MKKLLFIPLTIIFLISCSESTESELIPFNSKLFPQQWQLVAMTGSIANMPPITGRKMSWQESYTLNTNKTFVKSRDTNGNVSLATGTYTFLILSDGTYLELTYISENNLIGNCNSDLKEILRLNDSQDKLTATWWACDGPGLFYERKQ
ncbi:hypothetical protein [Aquimarina aggregata]|uniref:hypothetical protein n=1 Tax=Aquimarina aggregata TaxID=1642818 RepID=UPI00249138F7|nr:hypothetical protein [Aquimarina aggregata]